MSDRKKRRTYDSNDKWDARYTMKDFTYQQLQQDHIRFMEAFETKFSATFIGRIMSNYMDYVMADARLHMREAFEDDVCERLKHFHREALPHKGQMTYQQELKNKIQDFIFADQIEDSHFKSTLINVILDHFAELPFPERELIYCYDYYQTIESCIRENKKIRILHYGESFEVLPYKVQMDERSFAYYLIGYSSRNNRDYKSNCFKLSRIQECRRMGANADLSNSQKQELKKKIEKYGAAYVSRNPDAYVGEPITVLLTADEGYQHLYLQSIARQRPVPCKAPRSITHNGNKYYELIFDCSYDQIKNYFFSFGKEAIVVSPQILREEIIDRYQLALNAYTSGSKK